MDKSNITIEKFSDTEIKRIKITPEEIIPEQIIPEIREEEIIPLKKIEDDLEEVNNEISRKEASKADTLKQKNEKVAEKIAYYDNAVKQDEDAIALLVEQKNKLEADIAEAKDKGVKSELPKEELPVDVIDLQARVIE